jgi:hypothetical protein
LKPNKSLTNKLKFLPETRATQSGNALNGNDCAFNQEKNELLQNQNSGIFQILIFVTRQTREPGHHQFGRLAHALLEAGGWHRPFLKNNYLVKKKSLVSIALTTFIIMSYFIKHPCSLEFTETSVIYCRLWISQTWKIFYFGTSLGSIKYYILRTI